MCQGGTVNNDKMFSLLHWLKLHLVSMKKNDPKLFTWVLCYNTVPEPKTVPGTY